MAIFNSANAFWRCPEDGMIAVWSKPYVCTVPAPAYAYDQNLYATISTSSRWRILSSDSEEARREGRQWMEEVLRENEA